MHITYGPAIEVYVRSGVNVLSFCLAMANFDFVAMSDILSKAGSLTCSM